MNIEQEKQKPDSITQVIASGGTFQIELVKYAGLNDNERLIKYLNRLQKNMGRLRF